MHSANFLCHGTNDWGEGKPRETHTGYTSGRVGLLLTARIEYLGPPVDIVREATPDQTMMWTNVVDTCFTGRLPARTSNTSRPKVGRKEPPSLGSTHSEENGATFSVPRGMDHIDFSRRHLQYTNHFSSAFCSGASVGYFSTDVSLVWARLLGSLFERPCLERQPISHVPSGVQQLDLRQVPLILCPYPSKP